MPWTFWFYARADGCSTELLLDERGLESAMVSMMRTDMELHLISLRFGASTLQTCVLFQLLS